MPVPSEKYLLLITQRLLEVENSLQAGL